MKIAAERKHYDWLIMPDLYFATALILSEQILSYAGDYSNVHFGSEILKELGIRDAHSNYELILPLVYNFKQGIEIGIKSLGIIDYGEYHQVHDIKFLLDELKIHAKNTQNEKTIDKLHSETWPVLIKYYNGQYIPKIKSKEYADKQNEAERYPEYKNNKTYPIPERFEWVTGEVVNRIQGDIKFIEKSFAQAFRDIKPIKKFNYRS